MKKRVEVVVERSCGTCVNWDESAVLGPEGKCRVSAPVMNELKRGEWPITQRMEWCGRWKAKPAPRVEKVPQRKFNGDMAERTRMRIEDAIGGASMTIREIWQVTGISEDTVSRHLKTMLSVASDGGWPARWRRVEQAEPDSTPEPQNAEIEDDFKMT